MVVVSVNSFSYFSIMIDQESLVSYRSLSSETIINQQKWLYRVMFFSVGVITLGAIVGFLLSRGII